MMRPFSLDSREDADKVADSRGRGNRARPRPPTDLRTMPTITVNGESRTLPDPLTTARLLEELGYDRRRVAVEVNGAVVPQARHSGHALAHGDRVEVVSLVGWRPPEEQPAGQTFNT